MTEQSGTQSEIDYDLNRYIFARPSITDGSILVSNNGMHFIRLCVEPSCCFKNLKQMILQKKLKARYFLELSETEAVTFRFST